VAPRGDLATPARAGPSRHGSDCDAAEQLRGALAQAKKGSHRKNDDHESNEIDKTVHEFPLGSILPCSDSRLIICRDVADHLGL
jgi:hypothetical protein